MGNGTRGKWQYRWFAGLVLGLAGLAIANDRAPGSTARRELLRPSGPVLLNGRSVTRLQVLRTGDSVRTGESSVATIYSQHLLALLMFQSCAGLRDDSIRLECGGMRFWTDQNAAATVCDVRVVPASVPTEFILTREGPMIAVKGLKGVTEVFEGTQSRTVPAGQAISFTAPTNCP